MYLLTSECVLECQRPLGDFFKNRRAGRCHFFSLPQPSQPDTCRNKHKHLTPTLLTPHTLPHVLLCIHSIQPTKLSSHPSKGTPALSHPESSPGRELSHSKATLGRGEYHHTHTSSTAAPADNRSDSWPCPPTKSFQGAAQRKTPTILCDCSPSKWVESRHLVWVLTPPNYKPMATSDWLHKRTGIKPCP